MAFGTIYLDTNIFVTAFEAADETSERLSEIFANVDSQPGVRFATSELTLSELLVRPIRENDAEATAQYERLVSPSPWMDVFPILRSTLTVAAKLRARNSVLKLPDAIHIAAALDANCSHILTNDHGFRGTYFLSFGDKGRQQSTAPLTVIRPDAPTLSSILQSLAA